MEPKPIKELHVHIGILPMNSYDMYRYFKQQQFAVCMSPLNEYTKQTCRVL